MFKTFLRRGSRLGVAVLFSLTLVARPGLAATFTVTTTNLTGAGSLSQALIDANANPGPDLITFNVLDSGLTISPTNALPAITDSVTIDGSTQPGFAGAPLVELNGASAGFAANGLQILTNRCLIQALIINRFRGHGIEIAGGAGSRVKGCYLGLGRDGSTPQGNNGA